MPIKTKGARYLNYLVSLFSLIYKTKQNHKNGILHENRPNFKTVDYWKYWKFKPSKCQRYFSNKKRRNVMKTRLQKISRRINRNK